MFRQGLVNPFWGTMHTTLKYSRRPHNDPSQLEKWISQGFTHKNFTGSMYGMDNEMPAWTKLFLNIFDSHHVGLCLYKMETGDIMPLHSDTYSKFKSLYNIDDSNKIHRAIIFLEDWQSGHIFEINNTAITSWKAGDYIFWRGSTPHMAANLGNAPRYTAQLTFLPRENLL